jgi:isopenicillin-N epimerase
MSWGGSVSGQPARWQDELNWLGTRDPAPFLAVPAAIDFLEAAGIDTFRQRTHELARAARRRLADLTGLAPFVPDDSAWFGSMVTCPLPPSADGPPPPGRRDGLQNSLWDKHRIEIPVVHWHGRRFLRVSCHLYTSPSDLERLYDALPPLL